MRILRRMLSWQGIVMSLTVSMAALTALTLLPLEGEAAAVVVGLALLGVILNSILIIGGLSSHLRRPVSAGLIGLLVICAGPLAVLVAVNWTWANRAERKAHDILKASANVAGFGRLRALEGSGYDIPRHVWDIAGVSGYLVLLRQGHFESGDFPVVVAAHRSGLPSSTPALVSGSETLLQYTNARETPEGKAALSGSVVHVHVDCPRPLP